MGPVGNLTSSARRQGSYHGSVKRPDGASWSCGGWSYGVPVKNGVQKGGPPLLSAAVLLCDWLPSAVLLCGWLPRRSRPIHLPCSVEPGRRSRGAGPVVTTSWAHVLSRTRGKEKSDNVMPLPDLHTAHITVVIWWLKSCASTLSNRNLNCQEHIFKELKGSFSWLLPMFPLQYSSQVLGAVITSAKEVKFSVCWLVCKQDYTTATEQISTKLGWRMCLGPEQTPWHPNKGTDPHIF